MTSKQLNGAIAPDGSRYICLTDGNGNLVSAGGALTTGITQVSGASAGQFLYSDGSLLQAASGVSFPSGTFPLTITRNAIGAPATGVLGGTFDGLLLTNTTLAASGAQQYSPAIHWQGQGWGTTLGKSQSVDWILYSTPIQGAAPTPQMKLDYSVNGAAYQTAITINPSGNTNIICGTLVVGTASQFTVSSGIVGTYNNLSTTGLGLAAIYGAGYKVSLNTTSTAVASYTPTSAGGQMFRIDWVLSYTTASTPNLQVTYTDPNAGAQTITLYNTAMGNNSVQSGVWNVSATNASAIAITGTDSLALGDIFASATISREQ